MFIFLYIYILFLIALYFHIFILDLSSWEPTAEDMERFTSNKKEMDRYLGVYPYDRYLYHNQIKLSLQLDFEFVWGFVLCEPLFAYSSSKNVHS